MSVATDSYAEAAAALRGEGHRTVAAEQLYGFERATARRLALYRWLYETGRLHAGTLPSGP